MVGSIVDTAFLNIPFLASLGLSTLLLYWFYKDRNKRKLMFAIGVFIGAFGYQRVMTQNMGETLLFASPEWLFVPISLAVPIMALSSYFKKKNFDNTFKVFLAGTAIALLLFFTQISVEAVRVPLMISFMA